MATPNPPGRLTLNAAEHLIAEQVDGSGNEVGSDRVGVEVEFFPIRVEDDTRVPLVESVEILRNSGLGEQGMVDGNPMISLHAGGAVTFEPGGQIEYVTPPFDNAQQVAAAVEAVVSQLEDLFAAHNITLLGAGADPYNPLKTVSQQLPGRRYQAMSKYFDAIGPWGRLMMRNTASIQVSLDLQPANRDVRWRLANLLAPISTATFANSPTAAARNTRSFAWQHLDNSRTGFPSNLSGRATEAYIEFALSASVLLFRTSDDTALPGIPGFSFRDWIENGHAIHGHPTGTALSYHLTTLFPEVRLRDGLMELRSVDAQDRKWVGVPPLLLSGAIYDERTCGSLIDLLEPIAADPDRWWRTAAVEGLENRTLGMLASETWRTALEDARRLGSGSPDFSTVEDFLETFTFRGRSPADETVVSARSLAGQESL